MELVKKAAVLMRQPGGFSLVGIHDEPAARETDKEMTMFTTTVRRSVCTGHFIQLHCFIVSCSSQKISIESSGLVANLPAGVAADV